MMLHVVGQKKRGYITDTIPSRSEGDEGFDKWCKEDSMVRGWMIKTIKPKFLELFLDIPTAKEMWKAIADMFYNEADESHLYELRSKSTRIQQSDCDLGIYFAELKQIWQEIDQQRPISMKWAADIKLRQEEITRDRLYDFLAGLDDCLDQSRSELLRMKPLLSLNDSSSEVTNNVE